MPEPLHQLVYCDTKEPLIGTDAGVNVAAASLEAGSPELLHWHKLLYPLVSVDHPHDTLCYRVSEERGEAALMYRTVETSSRQQPFVHVLIGSRDELTPKIALGSFRWDWKDAIRPQHGRPSKKLGPVREEQLKSFLAAAQSGWDEVTITGERPSEVDQIIVEILDNGGLDEGPLPGDDDALISLGRSQFVLFNNPGQAHNGVPLPIGVLARLLSHLTGRKTGADIASQRIIGSGFSTHERKYRSGKEALPRWVFATEVERSGSYGLNRIVIDLRNIRFAETNKTTAVEFQKDFLAALQRRQLDRGREETPKPSGGDGIPGSVSADDLTGSEGSPAKGQETAERPVQTEPDDPSHGGSSPEEPTQPEAPPTVERPVTKLPPPPAVEGGGLIPPSTTDADPPAGDSEFGHEIEPGVASPESPAGSAGTTSDPGQPPIQPAPQTATSVSQVPGPSGPSSTVSVLAQRQQGHDEYFGMTDVQLIQKILSMRSDESESIVRSLLYRTRINQELKQLGEPVDLTIVREFLIDTGFAAMCISEFGYERQVRLYHAICTFAMSDQSPGTDDSRNTIARLTTVLASNKVKVCRVDNGIGEPKDTYPLAMAMTEHMPRTPDGSIEYEFGLIVEGILGRALRERLDIRIGPPPMAVDLERTTPDEVIRGWVTRRDGVVLALILVLIVVLCVSLGWVP